MYRPSARPTALPQPPPHPSSTIRAAQSRSQAPERGSAPPETARGPASACSRRGRNGSLAGPDPKPAAFLSSLTICRSLRRASLRLELLIDLLQPLADVCPRVVRLNFGPTALAHGPTRIIIAQDLPQRCCQPCRA